MTRNPMLHSRAKPATVEALAIPDTSLPTPPLNKKDIPMRTPWKWACLALLGLAGCDSITPLTADLGQAGTPPTVEATLGTVAGVGQSLTFTATADRPLPAEWSTARTLKMAMSGTMLSLTAAGNSFVAVLPSQAGALIARPDLATPHLFTVNGEHAMVAKVVFK
ncbi:MAG: hypothetical protein VKP72_07535 [bacterium]|nr:hypothetical protein [bacterium]